MAVRWVNSSEIGPSWMQQDNALEFAPDVVRRVPHNVCAVIGIWVGKAGVFGSILVPSWQAQAYWNAPKSLDPQQVEAATVSIQGASGCRSPRSVAFVYAASFASRACRGEGSGGGLAAPAAQPCCQPSFRGVRGSGGGVPAFWPDVCDELFQAFMVFDWGSGGTGLSGGRGVFVLHPRVCVGDFEQ